MLIEQYDGRELYNNIIFWSSSEFKYWLCSSHSDSEIFAEPRLQYIQLNILHNSQVEGLRPISLTDLNDGGRNTYTLSTRGDAGKE